MKKLIVMSLMAVASLCAADYSIATGAKSKTFYQIGENFKQLTPVDNVTTKGSVENLNKIYNNETDFALAFADSYKGFTKTHKDAESKLTVLGTAGKGCLYVAVRNDGKIDSEDDLGKEGLTVAIGKEGAGANSTWNFAAQLDKDYQKPATVKSGDATALNQLQQGKVDAVLQMQSPSVKNKIVELVNRTNGKVKFIDFNDYSLNDKLDGKPIYTYEDVVVREGFISSTVETICTDVLVIANTQTVDEDVIEDLTEQIMIKQSTLLK